MSTSEDTSAPRGRGRGRGKRSFTNYGSPSRIKKAEEDQAKIQQQLDKNENLAKNAKPKQGIDKVIEAGKQVVSKFFQGFESKSRGNIEVTLDDRLPDRISEVYLENVEQQAISEPNNNLAQQTQRIQRFRAGITLATAIKLQTSAPELEKGYNNHISFLNVGKFNLPEKASVIINQIGKTDLPNDNKLRIQTQGMAAKRMAVKALYQYHGSAGFYALCNLAVNNGFTNNHLDGFLDDDHFYKMIDSSRLGLRLIKELGKSYFLQESNRNMEFQLPAAARNAGGNVNFNFKIPNFQFSDDDDGNTIADVANYLNNPLFSATGPLVATDNARFINIICSLVFQIADLGWLRNPNRTMVNIDNNFNGTIIANVTFTNLLVASGIWNINSFISDQDLNDCIGDMIHSWDTRYVPIFRRSLKFKEIHFSDYGSESQMVQVEAQINNNADTYGFTHNVIRYKANSEVVLKTSESAAIFGIMAKFNKKVKFKTDFKINHTSTNRGILREFLKTDFV